MRRKLALVWIIMILFSSFIFGKEKKKMETLPLEGKKVVMVIAHEDFRDEEYLTPKEILTREGVKIITASSSLEIAKGMLGAKVKPDILFSEIKVKDYDAIVFIGGVGASEYWNNPQAQKIAQEAVKEGKLLAAICIAPVTLANAGVLKDKQATVFPSEKNRLVAKGVKYTAKPVEKDFDPATKSKIITAQSPKEAKIFAEEIKKALLEK